MKLLVIGLDGVDLNLINHFNMPFTQDLVKKRIVLPVKEDLWSRGWVKILSGLPATTTGAFYEQPALNGKTDFTQAYSTKHYPRDLSRLPLWEALDKAGVRSAFFNLPTTLPAPQINGFLVSGAGGGFSPGSRIPTIACYPSSLQDVLVKERVIWENRFQVSGIRSADLYIHRCIEAIWQRAKVYCDLVKEYTPINFGFHVQKEAVLITNLFMHDIQELIDGKRPTKAIHYLVQQFFENLDDSLKYLVEQLQPTHVALVSDHGAEPYRFSLNFNEILDSLGFLEFTKKSTHSITLRQIKDGLRNRLAKTLEPYFGSANYGSYFSHKLIDFSKTVAFSHFYVPGIFLNDQRFGGYEISDDESTRIVEDLCSKFNDCSVSKKFNLEAQPYRSKYANEKASDLLPDIWVNHPEDCFPEQKGEAVQKNPYYRTWVDLHLLDRDIASGKKSSRALCVFEKEFIDDIYLEDANHHFDLTIAYELIINHFLEK